MNTPLPIDAVLPDLCQSLGAHNRCLLVAQPGAGKTTRVPLEVLAKDDEQTGLWLLLEPRRAAARLAADYMASQLDEKVGKTVGFRVRGESVVSNDTRLEVVTQGILTRILQDNPLLEGIQGIIFDEFHERSLDADLGLALALDVQSSLREDLKILVMSATLDVASLLAVLGESTPVIDCPGRSWPVHINYRPAPLREAADIHQARIVREALNAHEGDILVFLPGQREIHRLKRQLELALSSDIQICPLHGRLPLAQQRQVLNPAQRTGRRIILSTDVAESSVTVPGVRIVIDAGMERTPVFRPRSGLTRLETRRVNRASADQRKGRAGREAAGFCYRLWSDELLLAPHREPAIAQSDLSGLAYELLRWGVCEPEKLRWVSPVPAPAFASGMSLLKTLNLVGDNDKLTATGRSASVWPTHPRLAAMLEYARSNNLLSHACWLVAYLEENPTVDDLNLSNLFHRLSTTESRTEFKRWQQAAKQWARRARCQLTTDDFSEAANLLAVAYPDRIAENRGGGKFRLVTGGQAQLPKDHPLARNDFLVIPDLDGQSSGARIFSAIPIAEGMIEELFPDTLQWRPDCRWDETSDRFITEEVRQLGCLELARRPSTRSDPEAIKAALLNAVRQRGYLNWSDKDQQLLGRLNLLHRTFGAPWPDVSTDKLLATMEQWLAPYIDGVTSLAKLDNLPPGQYLMHSLDWSLQQQMDELAPTHFPAPSGSKINIDYRTDGPVLAVKLQEMFGQTQTPAIANGRVPLTVHLLSPARRPVQVTRDLANFWQTTYFDVRKDLKGRYPKHPWPDDPLVAEATRHTKKRS